jgi:methyl coenzyme M reductase gamma subunit
LKAVANARREKFTNKRRERNREKRGEILRRTIKRRNQGPPAHVLQNMTQEQREMDRISRSVSEVGYVAMVKRRLGWKLKNPEAWKVEIGSPENQQDLDQMTEAIRQENLRRRSMYSDTETVETNSGS